MQKLLKKIASKSTHARFFHGSIVIKGGAILSTGFNHDNVHSEISALNKLWPSKRKGTTVINIRITKTGIGNSNPCEKCRKYMKKWKVSKVIYSIPDLMYMVRTGTFLTPNNAIHVEERL